ncbi:MAG: isocitrate/isopropylmalate dehydrogenase family protein [Candidatus Kapabacteria bacterium]|nr:isocitrate/isopropylmalate dehydrogenase family protein [Ignavibacteriota bacterium]MCW5884169.1 isocitrate/isopropylmalate dehydrogenase family protein [Candidatus Kapabacteria bacterium]
MKNYKIAWLPGDGVGVEVLEATKIVFDKLNFQAEYIHGDIGWEFWCKEGDALPQRTLDLLGSVDAAMFGAITSKPVKQAELELASELRGKGLIYRSPIVRMRQFFDLYICLRPCKAYSGNPLNYKDNLDMVVFRENTEDMYCGVEFNPVPKELSDTLEKLSKPFGRFAALDGSEYAISCKINTRMGSERIIRAAFEFAKLHNRKKVTVVHKANVVRATDGLFFEIANEVSKDFPDIQMDDANIDAMTMWMLKNPDNYDVLVAPNLYGDIISDLAAQMVGGLGFGCSGNIGKKLAVFEPSHGSAPKYTGLYKVNPIATILAGKMMLDWLGEKQLAGKIETAVSEVIAEGKVRTYDMGGSATTLEIARAIADKI